MREMKWDYWCDGHDDEFIPATIERTISIDGAKPILLDLCEQCDKNVVVVAELMDRGVAAELPKKRKSPTKRPLASEGADEPHGNEDPRITTKCRLCPHDAASRSALGTHVRLKHDMGLREMFA